jgi:hypothetical protein
MSEPNVIVKCGKCQGQIHFHTCQEHDFVLNSVCVDCGEVYKVPGGCPKCKLLECPECGKQAVNDSLICDNCQAEFNEDDICQHCETLIKGNCYYCKID